MAVAAGGCLAAAVSDLRTGSIPNRLTYFLLASVLAAVVTAPGSDTEAMTSATLLTMMAVGPLYARGLMGGGDAKLLVALAALDGPLIFTRMVFCSFVLGGTVAVVAVARRRSRALPFGVFALAGQLAAMTFIQW